MAFPTTPLDVKVELSLNGSWTDVTSYVYTRNPITITRGRQDEASSLGPSTTTLTFNNRDGRFSPRNPTGPYYGMLGRNTPVRVSARIGQVRLLCPQYEWAQALDSAGLSVTGDIDLRFDGFVPSWAENSSNNLINKSTIAGQRSYRMGTYAGGLLYIVWSADGTNELTLTSTVPLPQTTGRQAVRATLDVDNGTGGYTARFYYAPTMAGPWVQLGAPAISNFGTTSIFNGTGEVRVDPPSNSGNGGTCYSAEIRNGIGGSLVGNPIFSAQADGTTSFADAQGNTWTLGGGALITNRRYRFYGEIPAWPPSWDLSGKDVWTPVTASGVTRRLLKGAPLQGSFQRYVLRNAVPAYGYWPMEDAEGSTSLASGLSSGRAMTFEGTPRLAADDTFASSGALPNLSLSRFTGYVNAYAATGTIYMQFLMDVPAAGDVSAVVARLFTSGGTVSRWDFSYTAGGTLTLAAYDFSNVQLFTQSVAYGADGIPASVHIKLVQNGANIDWEFGPQSYVAGAGFGAAWTGTLATNALGAAAAVQLNPSRLMDTTSIGHLVVYAAVPDTGAELDALRGHIGEGAGSRVQRLCSEEGINFEGYGNLAGASAMGPQRFGQLVTLLGECEATDLGMLFELRERLGLAYRVRSSLYHQTAPLALAYGNLTELQPVEDDQSSQNDITVSRIGGSSARQELTSGALSTQAPPNGIGRYDTSTDINVASDDDLADQAAWRLHLGTVDEARYPVIRLQLETSAFAASTTLTSSALDLDVGDLITVSNPPAWLPPDRIEQIALGFTEVLEPYRWTIDVNCTPASPYDVGTYDQGSPATRYGASGSTLNSGITSTATSISIATAAGNPLWTTNGAHFPLDIVIGGERITLSAISGAASPQTGTVSARSVNGVVKAHSAGEAIQIADLSYYGL